MKKEVASKLSPEMVEYLQGKAIVFLQAIDPDTQSIYSTALSWLYATSPTTIHFAIDSKSKLIEILKHKPQATITFIGCESAYAVSGTVELKERKAEDVSIHLSILELQVHEVRDIIFYGGKIVTNPEFIKTYHQSLIDKLDREVYQAIRRVSSESK